MAVSRWSDGEAGGSTKRPPPVAEQLYYKLPTLHRDCRPAEDRSFDGYATPQTLCYSKGTSQRTNFRKDGERSMVNINPRTRTITGTPWTGMPNSGTPSTHALMSQPHYAQLSNQFGAQQRAAQVGPAVYQAGVLVAAVQGADQGRSVPIARRCHPS
jgi:hypothetical protein